MILTMARTLETALIILGLLRAAYGHGRLLDPPNRSSLWRFPDNPAIAPYFDIVEANYNDNELFCGGFMHQQNNNGKCGVCGDPYDAAKKPNEAGGKYAKGIIVDQYYPGQWIKATVELTAHHLGYFEFRLCPWNDPLTPITHECLEQYVLENGSPQSPRWTVPPSTGGSSQLFDVPLKLPEGLECEQCVLQWKYHAGNTWNCDDYGNCCGGCGPQEEFYGCADVAIGTKPTLPPPGYEGSPLTTTKSSTTSATTSIISTTTTTATESTTTTTSGTGGPCPNGNTNPHKYDCDTFYRCNGSDMELFDCPPGTVFNEKSSRCDHLYNVPPPCGTAGSP